MKEFSLQNPETSKYSGPVTAMLMSAITYCSLTGNKSSNVNNTFINYFGNGWKIVWESSPTSADHYAFVAYDNINQYVLAIRGSAFTISRATIENWIGEDFAVKHQVAWQDVLDDTSKINPCHSDMISGETTVPQISRGAAKGVRLMTALISERGQRLVDFLASIQADGAKPYLCITGHSLGGSTATAFSQWIAEKAWTGPIENLTVLTFAGPTISNKSFADRFNSTFRDNAFRYVNKIDVATMMAADISKMSELFQNSPYAPEAGKVKKPFDLADFLVSQSNKMRKEEDHCHSHYTHVSENNTIYLNPDGNTYPVKAKEEMLQWFEEAQAQHAHDRYLNLMKMEGFFQCVDDKHKP